MGKRQLEILKWVVWSLAALFFFYEFTIRIAPSVMVHDLMQAFLINAASVGNLTAFYLYVYAPMQIPVGILTDYFGARKLLTLASLACGVGCVIFAFALEYWVGALGRIFMGLGSSFGFVGLVYVSSHWFPKNKLAFLVGAGNSIGMLGAIIGQGPTSFLTDFLGWRGTYLVYGIVGLVLGVIIYFLVRNNPPSLAKKEQKKRDKIPHIFYYLKFVFKNKYSWLNAISCFLMYATTVAFAGLWGVPFLESVHGLSEKVAGFGISMIFIGWAIGGPLVGHISDRMKQRKPFLLFFPLLAFLVLMPVIYLQKLPVVWIYSLLFFVGAFSSAQILHFTVAIETNTPQSKGTAIAFTNFITMIGGAILQPFIGYLLDLNWNGTITNDIPVYAARDWQIAMSCFPISFLLAFVCTLFIKEKEHKKTPQVSF